MRTLFALWLVLGTAAAAQEPARLIPSETLAAQVMLDRAGFSPGEIDGKSGVNLRRALEAFQKRHGLASSGQLDQPTWDRLVGVTADPPPTVPYEISPDDVEGPFTPDIPSDLVRQSKLEALHYRHPLEALAERFHASPRMLRELNPGATFSTAGERIIVPNILPVPEPRPDAGARPEVTIVVSKAASALTVEDANGTVLFHAPVTTGSEHDPLPTGSWKVTGVHRNPVFNYNPDLFWDANPTHSKARIPAGPNNPVGVAWIDITKEHYGIHGTPEPARVGHAQSHGCVRLTNWDVERVLQWARAGTPVVFR